MYNLVTIIHIIVALTLIGIILVQRGRSSGLVEAMGGVESIFGTKTNALFVKFTVFLSVAFFVTSISLAYLAKQKSSSLFKNVTSDQVLPESGVKLDSTTSDDIDASLPETELPQTSEVNGTPEE